MRSGRDSKVCRVDRVKTLRPIPALVTYSAPDPYQIRSQHAVPGFLAHDNYVSLVNCLHMQKMLCWDMCGRLGIVLGVRFVSGDSEEG